MLDREQISRLVVQHLDGWRDYVRCLGARPADVEEVVQEVCVTVLARDVLPVAADIFPAYVRGMARHLLHRRWRDRRRHEGRYHDRWQAVSDLAWREADEDDERQTRLARLRTGLERCVGALAPHLRQLLAWRYQAGLDAEAIAERLHSSAEAVRARLHRLRAALRRCIEGAERTEGSAGHEA